jgi:hypothetical protein
MSGVFVVFCLLPVVLLLPWWLACDFGRREIFWTAIEVVGWQLLVITPAFVLASLTDDLGRVLLWTLLLVAALFTWSILLVSSRSVLLGKSFSISGDAILFSRWFVAGVVVIVGGSGVVVHQYLTRRFARSIALAVAWIGLIALIGLLWPWNWTSAIQELYRSTPPPIAAGLEQGLSFEVEAARGDSNRKSNLKDGSLERDSLIELRLRVRGLPDDMAIAVEHADQPWSWPDGLRVERSGFYEPRYLPYASAVRRIFNLPVQPDDPETVRWQQATSEEVTARLIAHGLPFNRVNSVTRKREGALMTGYAPIPNSLIEKMRNEPPAYAAKLDCFLFQPDVLGELPLKIDARASGQAQTFHLIRLDAERPLIVATKSAVSVFGIWNSTAVSRDFRSRIYGDRIMTMNRVTGYIALGQTTPRSLYIGGVVVTWNRFSISPHMVNRQGKWVPSDSQWFEHTSIVFLTNKEVAGLSREVTTGKFILERNATEK